MSFRRYSVLGAAILASGVVLTGCGLGAKPASDGSMMGAPQPQVDCDVSAENLTATAVDATKPAGTIRFATQGLKKDFGHFFDPLIAKFESENPGTEVVWEDAPSADDFDARMVTDARTCVMADVINVPAPTVMALSQGNLLVDLDNKLPAIGDRFIPGIWNDSGVGPEDHHTALPWYWTPSVVTYNKELMTSAGLDPENPPKTVAEMQQQGLQAAKNSGGKIQSIWGNTKWSFIDQWLNSGVQVMNEDNTEFTFADDAKAVEWLTNLSEVYAAGGIPKDSVTGKPDPGQTYNEGNLIFGSANPSFLRNVKKNAPNIYPHTGISGTLREPNGGVNFVGQFIAVSVTTQNLPLATRWADYVTNVENQLAWNKDPNVVIYPTSSEALADAFFTQQDTSDPLGQARAIGAKAANDAEVHKESFIVTGKISTTILQEFQLAITGAKSPKDALQTAQTETNKLLKAASS